MAGSRGRERWGRGSAPSRGRQEADAGPGGWAPTGLKRPRLLPSGKPRKAPEGAPEGAGRPRRPSAGREPAACLLGKAGSGGGGEKASPALREPRSPAGP